MKVAPGKTTTLLPDGPLTQSITLFNGTNMGGVASMRDVLTLVDGPNCDSKVNGGGEGNPGNTELFGGSSVPGTATCVRVTDQAAIIGNECFDSSGNQFLDCKGIVPPLNHPVIGLNSQYSNAVDPKNPAYVIAEDTVDDFTDVTTSFQPGCTTPPCGGGGGPHHLNGRETVVDLNQSCQVLTSVSLTPFFGGHLILVTGNIRSCGASKGLITFTFEGPLRGRRVVPAVRAEFRFHSLRRRGARKVASPSGYRRSQSLSVSRCWLLSTPVGKI